MDSVKGCGTEGKTVLMLAVEAHSLELVTYLCEEARCDINQISDEGNTALHYAAVQFEQGCDISKVHAIWRYLIEKGCRIDIRNNRMNQTPICKLPFGKKLNTILEKAFSKSLQIDNIPEEQIIRVLFNFPDMKIGKQQLEDFKDEMNERQEEWSNDQLAYREFMFLYERYRANQSLRYQEGVSAF